MTRKRLWQTLRLWMITSGSGRAEYLRKNKIFASVGEGCTYMDRKIPLYANLIRLGNNVHLASNVTFVTHDITHKMLNRCPAALEMMEKNSPDPKKKLSEQLGCIDIRDNVFVGAGSTILYNVRIGANVIIGAGSMVTKDIPDNSVAAGVPAKVICTLDAHITKRMQQEVFDPSLRPIKQEVGPELEKWCWDTFETKRSE